MKLFICFTEGFHYGALFFSSCGISEVDTQLFTACSQGFMGCPDGFGLFSEIFWELRAAGFSDGTKLFAKRHDVGVVFVIDGPDGFAGSVCTEGANFFNALFFEVGDLATDGENLFTNFRVQAFYAAIDRWRRWLWASGGSWAGIFSHQAGNAGYSEKERCDYCLDFHMM